MDITLLRDIVAVLALAILVLLLCHRLRIPSMVGLILTGIACGPKAFGVVHQPEEVEILAEVGIILLLFIVGTEFSPRNFLRMRRTFFLGGGLQVGTTLLGGVLIAQLLGRPFGESVFLGCLVALSSTAIVLKLLAERLETRSAHGKAAITMLIFQDILVVPMILIVPYLSGKQLSGDWQVVGQVAGGIVALLVLIMLGGWVLPRVFNQVARTESREVFLLAVLAICFGVAWLCSAVGLTLSLGAFLAGLLISDSEYRHQAIGELFPLQGVFTSFFFVSIGMLVDVPFAISHLVWIFLGAGGVICLKVCAVLGVGFLLRMSIEESLMTGLALAQVGEFSFILAKVGMDAGVATEYHHQIFLAVGLLTMIFTPFLMSRSRQLAALAARSPFARLFGQDAKEESTEDWSNHVVVIGFSWGGRVVAAAAEQMGIAVLGVDVDRDVVQRSRDRGFHVVQADATDRSQLVKMQLEHARLLVISATDHHTASRIAQSARHIAPELNIVGRCDSLSELSGFQAFGIDVVCEELEGAMALVNHMLDALDVAPDARVGLETNLRAYR